MITEGDLESVTRMVPDGGGEIPVLMIMQPSGDPSSWGASLTHSTAGTAVGGESPKENTSLDMVSTFSDATGLPSRHLRLITYIYGMSN